MKDDYVVYTALFGMYDKLHEPLKKAYTKRVRFICFTDQKNIKSNFWDVIYIEHKNFDDPVLMNRLFKINPHLYFKEFLYSIYIDSNILVKNSLDNFVDNFIDKKIKIAAPRHIANSCIYNEIETCFMLGKINKKEKEEWHDFLVGEHYPINNGLCENNIIFRCHGESEIIDAMNDWWRLFCDGPRRDQLSLMYVLWKRKLYIESFAENSKLKNKLFSITLHANNYSQIKKIMDYIYLHKTNSTFCLYLYKVFLFFKKKNGR